MITREFEPTTQRQEITAPMGSKIVAVRINKMGKGVAVMASPDDGADAVVELLLLLEANAADGLAVSDWDFVTSWLHRDLVQTCLFAKYPAAEPRKRRTKAEMAADAAAEAAPLPKKAK